MTSGKKAYFVGKPNPLMMRHAQKRLGVHSEDTVIIGDRMDTDIIAGHRGPDGYRPGALRRNFPGGFAQISLPPTYVLDGVGDIPAFAREGEA